MTDTGSSNALPRRDFLKAGGALAGGTAPDLRVRAVAGLESFTRSLPKQVFERVTVPTLLVTGGQDVTTPPSTDADRAWAKLGARPAWRVDIERADPTGTPLCHATIDHGGVATSSTRSRRWTHDGKVHHHAIDPATGEQSATDLAAVTVFAATGWQAEAFATAALLAGSEQLPAGVAVGPLTPGEDDRAAGHAPFSRGRLR